MQNCRRCHFKRWYKTEKKRDGRRYWKCGRCKNMQLEDAPFIRSLPRILYLDIETSLSEYYNFGRRVRGEFLNDDLLIHEWYIICWSASWMGESKTYSGCVTPQRARNWTDKGILKPIWKLMDSADIVAGHNVDKFDIKRLNTRFLKNGLAAPTNYRTFDTLKIARSKFNFESNTLDFISKWLGFRPKNDMSLADWHAIATHGDEKVLGSMLRYNRKDVTQGKRVLGVLQDWAGKPTSYGSRTIPTDKQSDLELLIELIQEKQ